MELFVSERLIKVATETKEILSYVLIGQWYSEICYIHNCIVANRALLNLDAVINSLPGGITLIGLLSFLEDDDISSSECRHSQCTDTFATFCEEGKVLLLSCLASEKNDPSFLQTATYEVFDVDSGLYKSVVPLQSNVCSIVEMQKNSITGRLSCVIPWHFEYSDSEESFVDDVQSSIDFLLENVLSRQRIALTVTDSNILLGERHQIVSVGNGIVLSTASDLYNFLLAKRDPENKFKKNVELSLGTDVFSIDLLQLISGNDIVNEFIGCVPIINQEQGSTEVVNVIFQLECLIVSQATSDLPSLFDSFHTSIVRQLNLASQTFSEFANVKKKEFRNCQTLSFIPADFCHPVSVCYPTGLSESHLEIVRRNLHQLWSLNIDRPYFRRGCSWPNMSNSYLQNVNSSVPMPTSKTQIPVDDGTINIIQGRYEYRHYMQDNFNDKGWGCAYRSFQTIWSWFVLQGYTEIPVPSHRQIQQALVDVGDRPHSFVGTQQWIGSLELSYCLSHMIDVSSKIISINSGSELSSKARELAMHFETSGTPVMIGGGVLAHTILGVCFNSQTGDCQFLVLDPHYTGEDNISTIVSKGWCGWKLTTFWEENAFYNLLLPIRPNVI